MGPAISETTHQTRKIESDEIERETDIRLHLDHRKRPAHNREETKRAQECYKGAGAYVTYFSIDGD